jgi:hypothetical protein
VFGDPLIGVRKACFCEQSASNEGFLIPMNDFVNGVFNSTDGFFSYIKWYGGESDKWVSSKDCQTTGGSFDHLGGGFDTAESCE